MPFLVYGTWTRDLDEYAYRENGVSFVVVFEGVYGNLPTCQILDGDSDPITGDNPVFTVTTTRPFGVNRYWDVIPFEYLHADLPKSQIQVFVNGVEGICVNMGCGFSYVSDDADLKITSQSLDGLTLTV